MKSATFAGYTGKAAELTYTQTGTAACKFSIAVNRIGRDKETGDNLPPIWVNCVIWATRGEKLAPHITQGKFVVVSGEMDIREYVDKSGKNRWSLDLNVQQFSFGGKNESGDEAPAQTAAPKAQDRASQPIDSEDIPF